MSHTPLPLPLGNPQDVGLCPQRLTRADALMRRHVEAGRVAGALTLVARRGVIVHRGRFGCAHFETGQPLADNALFRIYSMTKIITSVAVLMLLEEGRFMLDWPVSTFIPRFAGMKVAAIDDRGNAELREPRREVTLHDLLTHTGGLTYDHIHPSIRAGDSLEAFVDRVCDDPLVHQPGEAWHYSESTDVLGRVVEVVAGTDFATFLRQRIFEPLAMADTGFLVPEDRRHRLASIYTTDESGRLAPASDLNCDLLGVRPVLPSGGGGLISTEADYLRFALTLLGGGAFDGTRLLGRKTVALMTDNHLPRGHPPLAINGRGFGLGVGVTLRPGQTHEIGSTGEFGWGGAASTNVWIDPAEDMVTLIMMQHRPVGRFHLGELFRHTVYQALV